MAFTTAFFVILSSNYVINTKKIVYLYINQGHENIKIDIQREKDAPESD